MQIIKNIQLTLCCFEENSMIISSIIAQKENKNRRKLHEKNNDVFESLYMFILSNNP